MTPRLPSPDTSRSQPASADAVTYFVLAVVVGPVVLGLGTLLFVVLPLARVPVLIVGVGALFTLQYFVWGRALSRYHAAQAENPEESWPVAPLPEILDESEHTSE